MVAEYPAINCGPYEFELVTQSETVPDVAVFTPDSAIDPRLVDVQTDDSTKTGLYLLRIKVKYALYPINPGATKDFTIQIDDICETAPFDITPSPPPADETYTVARPAISTVAIAPFVVVPSYCPITYMFEVTPAPGDLTTFTFDDLNLVHTIETAEIARAGVYTV